MALPDLTKYDDARLVALYEALCLEQERRRDLENIPGQIASLRSRYIDGGGDPAALDPTHEGE